MGRHSKKLQMQVEPYETPLVEDAACGAGLFAKPSNLKGRCDEVMAMIKLGEARCKGCGLCVMVCPKKLLKVGSNINGAGYRVVVIEDMEACTGCALCAEMCPDVVITVFK